MKKPKLARVTRSMLVVGPARESPRKKSSFFICCLHDLCDKWNMFKTDILSDVSFERILRTLLYLFKSKIFSFNPSSPEGYGC